MSIHLAIAFDFHYYNPFCALLASIHSTHERGSVHFHVIAPDIQGIQRERIESYVSEFRNTIRFYTVEDNRIQQFVLKSTWTKAVYYRLYFPFIVPAVNRLIYIDCDTLVLKNLIELYEADMDGCPVAAVYDPYVQMQPLIGIHRPGEYFNSGVLLIDTARWREQQISEKAIDFLLKHPDRIMFVDQCAMNAVLSGNWKKLNERFNLLYSYIPEFSTLADEKKYIEDKVIIHFTLQRPWLLLCKNPYRYLYSKFLDESGLKEGNIIVDYSIVKLLKFVSLRVKEFYNHQPLLKKTWRALKDVVNK
jgi:lipopolysaccharide biosynthesis glycosyltransferase